MKKGIIYPTSRIKVTTDLEGESLEEYLRKAKENKEPIKANPGLVGYSVRQDGVLPQYDIRTDKFQVAQDSAQKIHTAVYADMMDKDGYQKNELGAWVPKEPQGDA